MTPAISKIGLKIVPVIEKKWLKHGVKVCRIFIHEFEERKLDYDLT